MSLRERLKSITEGIFAPAASPEMDKIIESIANGQYCEIETSGYNKKGQEKCRVLIPMGNNQYRSFFIYRNPNDNKAAIIEEHTFSD